VIADPRACDWQPSSMACGTTASNSCLTSEEISVLNKWYHGAHDASGKPLYAGGVPRGSEAYWPLWLTGAPGSTAPALLNLFGRDFLRYMGFASDRGETYDVSAFDFERDPVQLEPMSAVYDAVDPDLGAFASRGGKLLVYHGWADPLVTPYRTVEYVTAVQARMGAPKTAGFLRLFMLPGFDHCGIQSGPGPNDAGFDPLPALEAWVERGVAPAALPVARRGAEGSLVWSNTVCAYPPQKGCARQ
jgi:Tannase and feruloyl esterase